MWISSKYHNNSLLSTARKELLILMGKSTKVGRHAGTGKFVSVKKAQKDPKHCVVETIKRPAK